MTKRGTLLTIGILLILVPVSGLPSMAIAILTALLGLAVVAAGILSGPLPSFMRVSREPGTRAPAGLSDELLDEDEPS